MTIALPSRRMIAITAAVYGVFLAGWWLGQPVPIGCGPEDVDPRIRAQVEAWEQQQVDEAAYRQAFRDSKLGLTEYGNNVLSNTYVTNAYTLYCPDTEQPRLEAWLEGDWR